MLFFNIRAFLLISIVCLHSGCKTSKNDSPPVETTTQVSISNNVTSTFNDDKTYLLVIEESGEEREFLKFVVSKVSTNEIVLEKKFRPGHVRWHDNNTIELLDAPGMIEENKSMEEYVRLIKIPTNQ